MWDFGKLERLCYVGVICQARESCQIAAHHRAIFLSKTVTAIIRIYAPVRLCHKKVSCQRDSLKIQLACGLANTSAKPTWLTCTNTRKGLLIFLAGVSIYFYSKTRNYMLLQNKGRLSVQNISRHYES